MAASSIKDLVKQLESSRAARRGYRAPTKLTVSRVRLNSGGYDSHGGYWGGGAPLFYVENEDTGEAVHVRAADAKSARAKALKEDAESWFPKLWEKPPGGPAY